MRKTVLLAMILGSCGDQPAGTGATASTTSSTTSTSTGTTGTTSETPTTGTGSTTTTGSPTTGTTSTSETTSTASTTTDADTETTGDPVDPAVPWVERRGALHFHSPYSHDACDGAGLMNGTPNPGCLADLRADVCAVGHEFTFITDHPAHMQEYPFEQVLLYDQGKGDTLVEEGGAQYNRITCPDDHPVILAAGFEATHTLPLGLHHHVDPALYSGLTDALMPAEAKALVDGLKAGGAVVAIAHSEEEDLSAQRIVDVELDAMEWYNPHGNFKTVLGGDSISGDPAQVLDLLQGLLPFMAGSDSGAHPDLVYLRILPSWPVAGFEKWREVQRQRAVTGVLGSDVHQNVSVAPICDNDDPLLQAACVAAAQAILPESLVGLVSGGTLTMSDGDRLDSYGRILRWLENRLLTPAGDLTLATLQDSLRAGHNYGLFSVFGAPQGLRFLGHGPGDEVLWIGDGATGPVTLELRVPFRPQALGGAQFSAAEGDMAEVRAELWRTDAMGTTKVHEGTQLGEKIELEVSDPGAYHLEIWIRPHHLDAALGSEKALADMEYLWLITNPIRVLP